MDLSSLKNIIDRLKDTRCKVCKIDYDEKWCNQTCLFCKHFNPCRDTYLTIIKEMYWLYIKSGEDYKEFCNGYIDNLNKWCNKFKIIPNEYEVRYIEYESSKHPTPELTD